MTAEDWKYVEEKLKSFYNIVKLNCDGYKVDILLARVGQFKNEIRVYVNGVVNGEWCIKECEESRRFLRKISRSVYSQKQKDRYKKMSKKMQKHIGVDIDRKYSYYLPSWTSFNSLKSQLIKENSSIVLIKERD